MSLKEERRAKRKEVDDVGVPEEKTQWYNNKEIYEMMSAGFKELGEKIQAVSSEMGDLRIELVSTKETVKRYNNLVGKMENTDRAVQQNTQEIEEICRRIDAVENQRAGQKQVADAFRSWVPWVITLITFGVFIYDRIRK